MYTSYNRSGHPVSKPALSWEWTGLQWSEFVGLVVQGGVWSGLEHILPYLSIKLRGMIYCLITLYKAKISCDSKLQLSRSCWWF
ncbi:hypothetical protein GDO86_012390 [Hymenochirus boettgeri]|uniref:Uncharacterized protein n=1 Tax=Hymenochirus boettgeri TaxID=247094 RepID=A0A8T2ISR5_9PIPI|nr:hypothetical protein GDO86_012390 [Hymenochirus boettgeri]